jgi:hypothetical protein
MKLITLTLSIITIFTIISCGSDQLSKSEAKSVFKECQEKLGKKLFKTNIYRYGIIDISESDSENSFNLLDKHKEMENLGLVTISEPKKDTRQFGRAKGNIIEVSLTPKGKEYLVGRVDNMFGNLSAQFKSAEYEVKEITEIQEIPERNEAKVKMTFERVNETPFFEKANEKKNPKEFSDSATYRKTTDGWKLCD